MPDGSGFDSELDRWYRIAPAARGITVLPPNDLHTSGRVRVQADLANDLASGVFWLAACAVLVLYGELWMKLGATFAAIKLVESVMATWKAARFLRKRRSLPNVAQDGDGLLS